jgi:hypothetical protein
MRQVEKSSDARSILKEAASPAIKRKNLRSPAKGKFKRQLLHIICFKILHSLSTHIRACSWEFESADKLIAK